MADRSFYGDQVIRWITTMSVIVLAGIAAVISYKHMHALVLEYGETSWTAALLPLSVDGMIATSSMTLLADSRQGRRSGFLPWALLVIGSAASLAANVAVAETSAVGRLIAAWPSAALIGSYELLMRQVRHGSRRELTGVSPAPPMSAKPSGSATDKSSYEAVAKAGEPYEAPPTRQVAQGSSYDVQMDSAKSVIRNADEPRGS